MTAFCRRAHQISFRGHLQYPNRIVHIGTRGSALAMAQTGLVVRNLKKKFPKVTFETVIIKTTGDKITDVALSQIGGKGLFIKEIEEALLEEKIELAVHSLKDLPTQLPEELTIGAILKREDPHDCLISLSAESLNELRKNARIGTSSLRRQAQILWMRPDLQVENLRGNLDTRIRKLEEGLYDAIVVAAAGLKRLTSSLEQLGGEESRISPAWFSKLKISKIPYSQMLPAAGQGALAIEIRARDEQTALLAQALHHKPSALAVLAERRFLEVLEGGCQVPIGIATKIIGKKIFMEGMIAAPNGKPMLRQKISAPLSDAKETGEKLARLLLVSGGKEILKKILSKT